VTRRVVLLHGLWMPGVAMLWLAARLKTHGFAAQTCGYHSIVGGPDAAAPRLAAFLRRAPCDVVAHSLGGLVALETLTRHPDLPVRRLVCLGTPLAGSGAASGLARWPLASLWMGRSAELLRRGCATWPGTLEVGMVAGRIPRGLGALVAGFDEIHDGTVSVSETRVPGLADHVVVGASHSGLMFSDEAAEQVAEFLEHGRFVQPL
jgi:pimeloyl-ACP methyl ester carboxylesterase